MSGFETIAPEVLAATTGGCCCAGSTGTGAPAGATAPDPAASQAAPAPAPSSSGGGGGMFGSLIGMLPQLISSFSGSGGAAKGTPSS